MGEGNRIGGQLAGRRSNGGRENCAIETRTYILALKGPEAMLKESRALTVVRWRRCRDLRGDVGLDPSGLNRSW
jgi:hypothetical protein